MGLKLRGTVWYFEKMVEGHTIRRSTKTSDEDLAKQIAARWEWEAIQSIQLKDEAPKQLHAAIRSFLAVRVGTGGYKNACTQMRHFLKLPDVVMSRIKQFQVQAVITEQKEQGKAHNTIAVIVMYWNAFVNYCASQKWTAPPKLEPIAQKKTRIRVLTLAEENAILAALDPDAVWPGKTEETTEQRRTNRDLFIAFLHTGARLNEIQKMRWSQVDFEKNQVLILRSKNGDDSQIAMSKRLRESLLARKAAAKGAFVYPTKAQRVQVNTDWLKKAARRAGVDQTQGDITPHICRHTFATRMLQAGMTLVEVKTLLGHRQISSTMVYQHVQAGQAATRAAVVMDEMYA